MKYDSEHEPSSRGDGTSSFQVSNLKSNTIKTQPKLRCPICERPFDQASTTAMPFCSARCRQVDMGRWLTESYGIPHEGNDAAEGFDQSGDEDEA